MCLFFLVQITITFLLKRRQSPQYLKYEPNKNISPKSSHLNTEFKEKTIRLQSTEEFLEEYDNFTPPPSNRSFYSRSRSNTPSLNLNGELKRACKAKTRVGTPCKISSLPGRDYCYRHQSGDSVML